MYLSINLQLLPGEPARGHAASAEGAGGKAQAPQEPQEQEVQGSRETQYFLSHKGTVIKQRFMMIV